MVDKKAKRKKKLNHRKAIQGVALDRAHSLTPRTKQGCMAGKVNIMLRLLEQLRGGREEQLYLHEQAV